MQRVLKLRSPVWICVGKEIKHLPSGLIDENSWPVPGDLYYGDVFMEICKKYIGIYPLKSRDQRYWVAEIEIEKGQRSISAYIATLPLDIIRNSDGISWILDHPWTPFATKNAWLITDKSYLKKYTDDKAGFLQLSFWDLAKEAVLELIRRESNKHKEED